MFPLIASNTDNPSDIRDYISMKRNLIKLLTDANFTPKDST